MNPPPSSQRGAILIVTLVMLLLLTLLALGSMRGTTLEERMAGNLRDESQAFQAAEMAQRTAEAVLLSRSITQLQGMTSPETVTLNPTGLQPTTYTLVPLPGVRVRPPASSAEANEPSDNSVIRIVSTGKGAAQDTGSDGTPAPSSNVTINTLYLRR
ncbi:pilus assembly PilX family protein [Pseudomonas oryzihabitans]|uniref:Type IV pilus assembly protein PilX n=1 Tax=Pseudomonas oryzihabitans TaxID=47885 RepID=A0AAJ2BJD9_9PSED|nr:PilX N-terminal domain-containing pilus assembly protein [Pseudomonas psychrotolerans]MDR6235384.1 type IV pilus assembly protein PilX [Pseudomonas psychrotolerans]MDR6355378.1 type IV pilus assembly protein PilX [Pseudomonas psychrotolerans]